MYSAKVLRWCPIILGIFFALGCGPRRVSPQLMAEASYATTEWLYDHYGFINAREMTQLANRVTARLADAISEPALDSISRSDAERYRNYPWQVFVLNSSEPNAFSVGGGAIFVTAGLLRACRSEAEFAAIVSHEMGHQLLGHPEIALARGDVQAENPQYSFNLDEEFAADSLGLQILKLARYDPRHALGSLMIARRTTDRPVPDESGNWLEARSAHLEQELTAIGLEFPATQTTREFAKVQEFLASVSS